MDSMAAIIFIIDLSVWAVKGLKFVKITVSQSQRWLRIVLSSQQSKTQRYSAYYDVVTLKKPEPPILWHSCLINYLNDKSVNEYRIFKWGDINVKCIIIFFRLTRKTLVIRLHRCEASWLGVGIFIWRKEMVWSLDTRVGGVKPVGGWWKDLSLPEHPGRNSGCG